MTPGGIGLAEKLFEVRDRLLDGALDLVEACTCEGGCPGCVGPQVERHSPAKRAAALLLRRLGA
jgi:DEAD/DEAH box helicase domain-containing protein